MINFVIVAAIAAVLVLCLRSIFKNGGENCADCAQGSTCVAHATGVGKCPVSEDMLRDVNKALDSSPELRKAQGRS